MNYFNSTIKRKPCGVTDCDRLAQKDGFCFGHQQFVEKPKVKKKEKEVHLSTYVHKEEMSITKLITILDNEFSMFIRHQYGVYTSCCTCGASAGWKSFDCGHYMPRDNMATRFDERNCEPQCVVCNRVNDGEDKRFRAFLVEKHGETVVLEVEALAKTRKDLSRNDLLDMIKFYRQENKKLDQC